MSKNKTITSVYIELSLTLILLIGEASILQNEESSSVCFERWEQIHRTIGKNFDRLASVYIRLVFVRVKV
jgi:hypothetical protein